MKAAFRNQHQDAFLREVDERPLRPGEVRIAVEACGICGTDLHGGTPEGEIFGHEVAGRIAEIGPGVTGLEVGQPAVLESSSFCGVCAHCRDGEVEFCTGILSFNHVGNTGLGFSERMIAPARSVIPYEGLSPEVACLQEPLGVALDVIRVADIRPDHRVLLVGPGPIGLMAMEIIRHMGVRNFFVCGHRASGGRHALAGAIGCDAWIEPEELAGFDFDGPVDRVLVTAPPAAVPGAMQAGTQGSVVTYIGVGWTPERSNRTIDLDAMHFKKQTLRPSYACPALLGPKALDCLKRGIVRGERYLSHRFKLDAIGEAMRTARNDKSAIKIVVTP